MYMQVFRKKCRQQQAKPSSILLKGSDIFISLFWLIAFCYYKVTAEIVALDGLSCDMNAQEWWQRHFRYEAADLAI